ncbi:hypothetical protein GJ496_002894 [Pomphorhynchus laevis]|nr:hypothetical protein GJ496_002894 [Pomphorhynchus laevis]
MWTSLFAICILFGSRKCAVKPIIEDKVSIDTKSTTENKEFFTDEKSSDDLNLVVDEATIAFEAGFNLSNASFVLPTLLENYVFEKYLDKYKATLGEDTIVSRKRQFLAKLYIYLLNAVILKLRNASYSTSLNELTILSPRETQQLYGFKSDLPDEKQVEPFLKTPPKIVMGEIPQSLDWREKDVVGPVLNQGVCGACYAFCSAGVVEAIAAMQTGIFRSFSMQQIIDCSTSFGNLGCAGGTMENSYVYLIRNGGIGSYQSYPYVGQQERCKNVKSVFNFDALARIPYGNEEELLSACIRSPVSVGMDASQSDFLSYSSGIYDNPRCSSTVLNHAVLLVGFGELTENGKIREYWLLKNSWGTSWGEKGYFKLPRNENNFCGVASQASIAYTTSRVGSNIRGNATLNNETTDFTEEINYK